MYGLKKKKKKREWLSFAIATIIYNNHIRSLSKRLSVW